MTTPKTISPALAALQAKAASPAADEPRTPNPDPNPEPTERIFYGELPPAISYLTAKATPIFFYQGYHVTSDPEVIDYCKTLKGVEDVTGQVAVADVPRPESRSRQRSWASAEKTSITPGELLARAVRVASTTDLGGNSAASNSTV